MTPPFYTPAVAARVVWPRLLELARFLEHHGAELVAVVLETTDKSPRAVDARLAARELRGLLTELGAESERLEYGTLVNLLEKATPTPCP